MLLNVARKNVNCGTTTHFEMELILSPHKLHVIFVVCERVARNADAQLRKYHSPSFHAGNYKP